MYIDVIVLVIAVIVVVMFFRSFSSFVYFMAIVDIFLRILTFVKNNIGLPDVRALLGKYFPESIFGIIDEYTTDVINICLKWAFVIIMVIFLVYVIKTFVKKKK